MFRRLNRLAQPEWYSSTDYYILQLPSFVLRALNQITSRPILLPMVIWLMLMMEERSLLMSKRYAAAPAGTIDPLFMEVYRSHAEDEARHVQIDWHLLDEFYAKRPRWVQSVNARLLESVMTSILIKPRRSNVRIIELLVLEYPELRPLRERLIREVHGLADNVGIDR